MMQFSESATPHPLNPNTLGLCLDLPLPLAPAPAPAQPLSSKGATAISNSSWPSASKLSATATAATTTTTTTTFSSASCMEQLLVHCAHAVDRNDATLAHQILWVLNTIAPPDGDSTQRLTSAFLRALVARASSSCRLQLPLDPTVDLPLPLHRFSPLDLASFVDLTPYHRFGYTAANAAIADAAEGFPLLHIVDLSTTHCMQIPTLIDALAARPEGPPFIKLTVPTPAISVPPLADFSYDELGARLVNFARSRNVGMEFSVVPSNPADGFETLIQQLRLQKLVVSDSSEALIINCQMMLRYISEETATEEVMMNNNPPSLRSMFLKNLRSLEPNLVTLVDEDVDLTCGDVVSRLRTAFNYLWIPYDAVDTFLPRGGERRRWYEAEIGWKIENLIACEGMGRVERGEGRGRCAGRMREAGFRGVGFGEEAAGEVKGMLDEHAAGWGLKKEEEVDLVLTWKGHNVVFVSAWVAS